jgi:membrane protein
VSPRTALALVREAVSRWVEDHAPSMGAALAFYTLFSIAPLLLIVISVAGLVFGEQAARAAIFEQLTALVGANSAQALETVLSGLDRPFSGIVGAVAGVGTLLIGATSVFAELQAALDRIWRAPSGSASGLVQLLRTRLLSLGMVLGIGFLLLVSLIVSAALAALGQWWAPRFGDWIWAADVVNLALSFAIVTLLFAMIYKWMPSVRVAWRDVWTGAAITAALFTIGKFLIGQYIGRSGVASAFGAAASVIAFLLWLYYSAQIFLLGAEFTHAYARRHGSLRPVRSSGDALAA